MFKRWCPSNFSMSRSLIGQIWNFNYNHMINQNLKEIESMKLVKFLMQAQDWSDLKKKKINLFSISSNQSQPCAWSSDMLRTIPILNSICLISSIQDIKIIWSSKPYDAILTIWKPICSILNSVASVKVHLKIKVLNVL